MPKKPAPVNRAQPKKKQKDAVVRAQRFIYETSQIWVKGIIRLSHTKCKENFSLYLPFTHSLPPSGGGAGGGRAILFLSE